MSQTNDIANHVGDNIINGGMYESFNEFDKNDMMKIEHDVIKQTMNPSELIVHRNQNESNMINQYNHNKIMDNVPRDNTSVNNLPQTNLEKLLESHKDLEAKLDLVLNKLEKIESGGESKENFHDIILFAVFGVFFIYILDSVNRIGKKS